MEELLSVLKESGMECGISVKGIFETARWFAGQIAAPGISRCSFAELQLAFQQPGGLH
jgi:hypothetical protein